MDKAKHLERLHAADRSVDEARKKIGDAKYRQRYHFMPEAYWMNDPNGFIYFRGQYHIFYQFHPFSSAWGSMYWGHAVSDDLLHWKHLPIALAPSESYDDHPRGGIFSGSAVEHNGEMYAFYTATTNYGEGFVQTQCLAKSTDGIVFEKYAGNPVIRDIPSVGSTEFRDPKVWRRGEFWYMVLGTCKDNFGKAVLYKSSDLYQWEFKNVLAESRGESGVMWECPDVFEIDGKCAITFSPVKAGDRKAMYLVGDLDYQTGKLNYTTIGEVDWGFDAYAPQSMLDPKGRRLMFTWANSWDWMPWFKDYGPTPLEGWCGSLTLPRQIELDPSDNLLKFKPINEIEKLRARPMIYEGLTIKSDECKEIAAGDGISFELILDINLQLTNCPIINLKLRNGASYETLVSLDLKTCQIIFDRNNADRWSKGVCHTVLRDAGKDKLQLRIFSDTSSIEIYTDGNEKAGYKTVLSGNIYPDDNCNKLIIESINGDVYVDKIQTFEILSVW